MKGKIYKNRICNSPQNENLTTELHSMTAYKSPSRVCQSPLYKYYQGQIKNTASREDSQSRKALTRVISNPQIFDHKQQYNQNSEDQSIDKINEQQLFNRSQSWLGNENNHNHVGPFKSSNINSIQKYMRQNMIGSEYIAECERRQRQRILTIQKTFQLEIEQYQETIKSKDSIIQQLKKSLQEKQKVISRLQEENCNLSSRSYGISFRDEQKN